MIACVKHYRVQQYREFPFLGERQADERTMREVYLPHFKKAIDAGAASVMGAYNLFNGDTVVKAAPCLRISCGMTGASRLRDFRLRCRVRDTKKAIEAGWISRCPCRSITNAPPQGGRGRPGG